MTDLNELISTVKKFPLLYEEIFSNDYKRKEDQWNKIAKKCGIQSAHEAYKLWNELVNGYIDYLRDGTHFDYANDMIFIQSHLVSIQSDSDELDEDELQRIIDSDSNQSSLNSEPAKRQHIASTSQDHKTYRKHPKLDKILKIKEEKTNATADSSTTFDDTRTIHSNISGLSSMQLIFLGYAKILESLPLSMQIRTKHKISQIINNAEISLLDLNDTKNPLE